MVTVKERNQKLSYRPTIYIYKRRYQLNYYNLNTYTNYVMRAWLRVS